MKPKLLARLGLLSLLSIARLHAQDNVCGGSPCEETDVCASPGVLVCSDWNDLDADGWIPSSPGWIVSGTGRNGSGSLKQTVNAGQHSTSYFDVQLDPAAAGYGPLHARFYVRFSPGYNFKQPCGLSKMFYLETWGAPTYWRVMLGIREANVMGGSYAGLPDTVGVFGFDYIGHLPEGGALPMQAGDTPVLIQPDTWYCVEFMAHWTSRTQNTVKIWVDGTLTMTRENFDDGAWTSQHRFDNAQDSSYFGGNGAVCAAPNTQSVYKDNHVIATHYIGPIGASDPPPPPPDTLPPAPPTNLRVVE